MFARRRACYVVVLCVPISYRGGGCGGRGGRAWWLGDDAMVAIAIWRGRRYVRTYIYVGERTKDATDRPGEPASIHSALLFLIKTKKYLQAGLAHLQLARKVCQLLRSTAACRTLDTQTLLIGDDNKEHLQNIQESLPRLPR